MARLVGISKNRVLIEKLYRSEAEKMRVLLCQPGEYRIVRNGAAVLLGGLEKCGWDVRLRSVFGLLVWLF